MGFCETLPANVVMDLTYPGENSYLDVTLSDAGDFDGDYAAWCIDVGHSIDPTLTYGTEVYCSYGELEVALTTATSPATPHIDNPEKLAVINWILNNISFGEGEDYTWQDVQGAIWAIIDLTPLPFGDEGKVADLLALIAAAGEAAENYMPEAGGYIAVILAPENDAQVLVLMADFNEEGAEETAWGYGYDGTYCDPDGASGTSFTDAADYGGNAWGWYFYGCLD